MRPTSQSLVQLCMVRVQECLLTTNEKQRYRSFLNMSTGSYRTLYYNVYETVNKESMSCCICKTYGGCNTRWRALSRLNRKRFCKTILTVEHFSRPTTCSHFCTAPKSNFPRNSRFSSTYFANCQNLFKTCQTLSTLFECVAHLLPEVDDLG